MIAVVLLVFLPAICRADFSVYFKDGTQRNVSKIHFKGENADLYLSNGMVMTVPANAIEYKTTGIDPPKADEQIIVYGKGPGDRQAAPPGTTSSFPTLQTPVPAAREPDQPELRRQWETSDRIATAMQDFGPIRSGETVKIAASTDLSYTVIHRQADGTYHRMVISSMNFSESFKIETPLVPPKDQQPETAEPEEPVPAPLETHPQLTPRLPREIPPPPEPAGPRPTLWTPFAISIVLLLAGMGLTIALSHTPGSPVKRRK